MIKRTRLARAVLVGAASVLGARSAVQAALTITWTETPNVVTQDGLFDRYVFTVTAITGADNVKGPAGQDPEILLLDATWSTDDGDVLLVPGANVPSPGQWTNYIASSAGVTPPLPSSNYKSSFVNLPALFGTASRSGGGSASIAGNSTSGTVTAIHGTSTSFTGHWLQSNPGTGPGPAGGIEPSVNGGNFATIYVSHGGFIEITSGDYGTYATVGGQAVTTPISSNELHPIMSHTVINLASATQSGSLYGTQLNSFAGQYQTTFNPAGPTAAAINVANGSPGFANNIAAGSGTEIAHVAISGFSASDQEIYALKLKIGTSAPTSAQVNSIVSFISGETDDGVSSVANLLSTAPGSLAAQIAGEFPAYDLMLTVNAGSGSATPYLGFDFSQLSSVNGVIVTDVAAVAGVPEPTSATALLIGTVGLLLGRRRRNALMA